jgi:large repetitive protein
MAKATRLRLLGYGLAWTCVVLFGWVGLASAQVTLDRYVPAPMAEDGFKLARPEDPGDVRFGAQLQLDYARNPLIWVTNLDSPDRGRSYAVVQNQLVIHPIVSLGMWNRVLFFVHLPLNAVVSRADDVPRQIYQQYDQHAALGGLTLGARLHLYGSRDELVSIAAQADLGLPISTWFGSTTSFVTESKIVLHLAGLLEFHITRRFRLGASLGATLREKHTYNNIEFANELNFVPGAGYLLIDDEFKLEAMFEFFGSALLASPFSNHETPMEFLLGLKAHLKEGWSFGLAGAMGIWNGYGSPDYRVIGMIGWTMPWEEPNHDRDQDGIPDDVDRCPDIPEDKDSFEDEDGCPDPDNDKDGILDAADKCPLEAEDKDGFEDEDGCPDPDNDQDGILDAADKCPIEAEDKDGFEDEDGCLDPDNDKDGILDTADKCPLEAEDKDGFQDDDGCPDPDNDNDGILDAADKCPNEAETKNNIEDEDGCPDLVRVQGRGIVTMKPIRFETNKTTLLKESEETLMEIVAIMQSHMDIVELAIEGHTDSKGNPAANMALSAGRAAAVRTFLIGNGVAADRLTSQGFGDTMPMADNATTEGRAKNRRVDFNIMKTAP